MIPVRFLKMRILFCAKFDDVAVVVDDVDVVVDDDVVVLSSLFATNFDLTASRDFTCILFNIWDYSYPVKPERTTSSEKQPLVYNNHHFEVLIRAFIA